MAALSRSIGDDIVEIHAPQVDITHIHRRRSFGFNLAMWLFVVLMLFCFGAVATLKLALWRYVANKTMSHGNYRFYKLRGVLVLSQEELFCIALLVQCTLTCSLYWGCLSGGYWTLYVYFLIMYFHLSFDRKNVTAWIEEDSSMTKSLDETSNALPLETVLSFNIQTPLYYDCWEVSAVSTVALPLPSESKTASMYKRKGNFWWNCPTAQFTLPFLQLQQNCPVLLRIFNWWHSTANLDVGTCILVFDVTEQGGLLRLSNTFPNQFHLNQENNLDGDVRRPFENFYISASAYPNSLGTGTL